MAKIKIAKSVSELKTRVKNWQIKQKTIGFVPTMGALHAGHLSLIDLARQNADKTIASIYVNETQFAPDEDFAAYPRDYAADIARLEQAGCDLVFAPKRLYHKNHATSIKLQGAALGLETDYRPHFFDGVALIVTKLFNLVEPDIAVFGQKDYQQLLCIKQLVRDLDIDVKIIGAPIMRENDGLAMSSRNRYFDENSRKTAAMLNKIMFEAARKIAAHRDIKSITDNAIDKLLKLGFAKVDYFAVADSDNLGLLTGRLSKSQISTARLLVAAHCPASANNNNLVRLIDNCALANNS